MGFLCLLSSGFLCDWWGLRVCGVLCAFSVCFVLVLCVTSDVCVSGFLCALCILWDLVFSVTARWGLYVCVLYGSSEFWCSVWPVKFVCLVWFVCFWCLRCSVLLSLLSSGVLCDWWGLCVCGVLCVLLVLVFCVNIVFVCPLSSGVVCVTGEVCVSMVFCVLSVSAEFWCSIDQWVKSVCHGW